MYKEVLCALLFILVDVLDAANGATATEETYQYVGCFTDDPSNRDLKEKEVTFSSLTLSACADACRGAGWAYAGLQAGEKCFCGPKYGAHGVGNDGACNFTCSDSYECGGVAANSLYYTVKIDALSKIQRADVVHVEAANFDSARRICIQNGGDLSLLESPEHVNATVAEAATKKVTSAKLWFGLRRVSSGWYAWTDSVNTNLKREAYAGFWASGETHQNPCVVVDLDTARWESTSCYAQYPYVCHQIPPEDDGPSVTPVPTAPPSGDSTNLALVIVLPLFSLCFGGSCLFYCIAKAYRNCKRKKKMQMEKEQGFDEFEPGEKPKGPPPGEPPVHTEAVKSAPDTCTTPVEQFRAGDAAPGGEEEDKDKSARDPSSSPESAGSTRPATSNAVTLSGLETARSTSRSLTPAEERKEKRRNKLLKSALIAARERKAGRESKMSDGPDRPDSVRPDSATVINEHDDLPIPEKHRKRRKKRESPDSGDSMTDLLADAERKEEAKKMAIQDIMKVKMLMKDQIRRPRKIIAV